MSKRMKDTAMVEMLNQRHDTIGKITELKNELQNVEYEVMTHLLRSNETQFLKVDWTRLNRRNWS